MMLGRCPVCHAHISLEAVCQDEAGRELLGLLATLPGETGRALVQYLGLFRPEKRDLANDRALRLAREALALSADPARLARAMSETVEALRAKGGGPLRNHNYLRRVLEGLPDDVVVVERAGGAYALPARRRVTAAEQAVMAIRSVSFGDDDAGGVA